jgi:hypothetical protein
VSKPFIAAAIGQLGVGRALAPLLRPELDAIAVAGCQVVRPDGSGAAAVNLDQVHLTVGFGQAPDKLCRRSGD